MTSKALQLQQLNAKMLHFKALYDIAPPPTGWVKAIRKALGMSMQQLGTKLAITKQSIQDIEKREAQGAITIQALRQLAQALDMKLVYGFVPNDGSLDALIEKKATAIARQIVLRTTHTMKLEDQENSKQRIENAIAERVVYLKYQMPKILWD